MGRLPRRCASLVWAAGWALALSASAAGEPGSQAAPFSEELDRKIQESLDELLSIAEPEQFQAATKITQRPEEAPAIVTVISGAVLRQWGYQSVVEALSHVLGFYVVDDLMIANAAVRGVSGGMWAESGVLKVMIDGHSVSFRPTAGTWLGPALIPLDVIERVEIIRGPGSALYGADAFLGVVNVVTRTGAANLHSEVTFGGSSVGRKAGADQEGFFGTTLGRWEVVVSGRKAEDDLSGVELPLSSPHPTLPSYSAGRREARGQARVSRVGLLRARYDGGSTSVTLTGYATAIERGAELSPWLQLGNGVDAQGRENINRISLAHGFFAAKVETRLPRELELSLDAVAFAGSNTPLDRIETGSDVFYVERQLGFLGGELTLEGKWKLSDELIAVAGAGILFDREQLPSVLRVLKVRSGELEPGTVIEASSTRQGTRDFINPGVYLQALWSPLHSRWSLTGGLRYDYHNIYGNQLSGRLGAVSRLTEKLRLKLLYGNAFKAPSPLLLHAVPLRTGDIVGNPNLRQQFVHTVEGQLSYTFSRQLSVNTGGALNLLLNKAEFTTQGLNQVARNLAQVWSASWESGVEYHDEDKLRAYLNLALQVTRRFSGQVGYQARLIGTQNEIYPPILVHAGVLGRLPFAPLRAAVEASFFGERRATDTNILQAGEVYTLPPYFLLGASVSTVGLRLFSNRETVIGLTGRNLTGTAVADPGFAGVDYPRVPRSLFVDLRQEF